MAAAPRPESAVPAVALPGCRHRVGAGEKAVAGVRGEVVARAVAVAVARVADAAKAADVAKVLVGARVAAAVPISRASLRRSRQPNARSPSEPDGRGGATSATSREEEINGKAGGNHGQASERGAGTRPDLVADHQQAGQHEDARRDRVAKGFERSGRVGLATP